ncbi:MAG TPA: histidine kinase, partial [Streptosporangiaceae bacterium]
MTQHSGSGPRPPSGPGPELPVPEPAPASNPALSGGPGRAAGPGRIALAGPGRAMLAGPGRAVLAGPGRAMLAGPGRAVAWIRRHPRVADSALVIVLFLLSPPLITAGRLHHPAWSVVVVAGLLLPLVWRRRAPFAVFLAICGAAFVQWLFLGPVYADLALFIGFYTVAAYQRARQILVAAVLIEAGAVLATLRYVPAGFAFWSWMFITGTSAAAGFLGYNVRTRRAYLAALEDRAARLERERDQQAQLAASAERTRIAREMHDIIAHNLAVMIALADGAAYTAPQDLDQAVSVMGQVSDTGRSALTDMRRLLGIMREPAVPHPPADLARPDARAAAGDPGPAGTGAGPVWPVPASDPAGPVPASDPAGPVPAAGCAAAAARAPQPTLADLDELLATVRGAGLAVRLSESGRRAAAPAAQLAAYRIIQESLTNTLKHARASAAWIRITYRPQAIEVDVADDGQAQPGAAGRPGHGLAGMTERAAVFGGIVAAGPRPGGGWRVHATLNLEPAG